MRVTNHSGRGYGARHNDRNFDVENAEHIDESKASENVQSHYYSDEPDKTNLTFEQAEKLYYKEHFQEALNARNEKYKQTRNNKLIKSIDDYYNSRKTCPEDVIFQVGKFGETIESDELLDLFVKYVKWQQEKFPNVQILSFALHNDEPGAAPHIQFRQVWQAHDKNGNLCVSQSAALREMGIERPDLTKKESRYNNAKMTYTAICREKMQELAKEAGFAIETEPKERTKTGLKLVELKARTVEEKLNESVKKVDGAIHNLAAGAGRAAEGFMKGGKARADAANYVNKYVNIIKDTDLKLEINTLLEDDFYRAEQATKELARQI